MISRRDKAKGAATKCNHVIRKETKTSNNQRQTNT